jgi:hypothetical protein
MSKHACFVFGQRCQAILLRYEIVRNAAIHRLTPLVLFWSDLRNEFSDCRQATRRIRSSRAPRTLS